MAEKNEISVAELAQAENTRIATEYVKPEGKVERLEWTRCNPWRDNPRDTPTPAMLADTLALFERTPDGGVVWSDNYPAVYSTVLGAVIGGNLRIAAIMDGVSRNVCTAPSDIPCIMVPWDAERALLYALDSSGGEQAKPRHYHEAYLLQHSRAKDMQYPSWVAYLLRVARNTVRTLAPAVDAAPDLAKACRAGNGHLRKYYNVAVRCDPHAVGEYVAHVKGTGNDTVCTSIDKLYLACADGYTDYEHVVANVKATAEKAQAAKMARDASGVKQVDLWRHGHPMHALVDRLTAAIVAGRPAEGDTWSNILDAIADAIPAPAGTKIIEPEPAPEKPAKSKKSPKA